MMILGLLCALGMPWGAADDSAAAPRWASVAIATGNDTAIVFVDSLRRGVTPLTIDSLPPGEHVIRLVQADVTSWFTGTIVDTVHCAAGERRMLRYVFDRRVMILTDPSGATLFAGDSALGTTPMVIAVPPAGIPGGLSAAKPGYERTPVALPAAHGAITRVTLKQLWESEPAEGALVKESSGTRSSLRLYVTGGLTVVAGMAAAYFKIKADNRNSAYQLGGDPALRDETRRLDTAAGVSLIATQIGFGFLTYFLLAD